MQSIKNNLISSYGSNIIANFDLLRKKFYCMFRGYHAFRVSKLLLAFLCCHVAFWIFLSV